jgi:hypothetical protein
MDGENVNPLRFPAGPTRCLRHNVQTCSKLNQPPAQEYKGLPPGSKPNAAQSYSCTSFTAEMQALWSYLLVPHTLPCRDAYT